MVVFCSEMHDVNLFTYIITNIPSKNLGHNWIKQEVWTVPIRQPNRYHKERKIMGMRWGIEGTGFKSFGSYYE
ncbi:hypothetical protein [Aquibacillus rhizosphaerae]|uniref:Uncharacterized protein n=1 Tax=Aquibacillus rhizosphaerae TaxID=3051431 RepID=A0ABT7L176_9BACI|nr:hypothetical protein [Aquibacillus sp. LR5S19]MDL4839119.1 hypothetical protein [Aquibacillus sp. LR5S19]